MLVLIGSVLKLKGPSLMLLGCVRSVADWLGVGTFSLLRLAGLILVPCLVPMRTWLPRSVSMLSTLTGRSVV